ncbi:MAG: alkaline shock response membrane anchor protein AmaP [Firmicutes bacterium]|nr:alkaline shock response membrane anchor protein AmaP [Bacillota bacterium]
MSARERLYLIILALIFGAAAVLVGGAALSLYPLEFLRTSINAVYGHWEYALLAVLFLALAVYLLIVSMRRQKTIETITQQGLLGELRISFAAVESLVLKAARTINGVRDIKTRIVYTEAGLVIYLRAITVSEQKIPQLAGELQTAVKEYVESITGCTVAEIKVLIENVSTDTVQAARK